MKKFYFLLILMSMLSCTSISEPNEDVSQISQSSFNDQYEMYALEANAKIREVYCQLSGDRTRMSDSSNSNLIDYIANMSKEQIDSLASIYCTPEIEEQRNALYEQTIEILVQMTNSKEVELLFGFVNDYIDCGGNSYTLINEALDGRPEIIANCIIRSAAAIDVVLCGESTTRAYNNYCLHQMMLGFAGGLATSAIETEVVDVAASIPGLDLVAALGFVGVDCISAIELAHKYDECCATHWE